MDELREILLSHVRSPKNSKDIGLVNAEGECRNPLCGDHVKVLLNIQDDVIKEIQIKTSGCAISIASASLMSGMLNGLTLSKAQETFHLVHQTFRSSLDEAWPKELEKLNPLKRIKEIPMKIPCTLIGWLAFEDALKKSHKK
jgi:nitrogen fixation NifU-like protein